MRVATLGGPGTFSHQAALRLQHAYPALQDLSYHPSTGDLYDALDRGTSEAVILSEQSSRHGWDEADQRAAPPDSSIYVYAGMVVPYHCHLLARDGTSLADIGTVYGHGSLRQCRRWLDANLPGVPARIHEKNSVEAAMEVATGDGSAAVVSTAITAELTGLVPLAEDIDGGAAANWWVVTSTPQYSDEPDHVIVSARLPGDGSLLRLADLLRRQGFQLTTAYSQASGNALFEHDYLLSSRGAGATGSLQAALARFDHATRLVGAYRTRG